MEIRNKLGRRGQIILMLALGMSFLLALGSLSVDFVMAYAAKQSLAIAIDSVALTSMRGLASGVTYADQAAEISKLANRMLAVNFPTGHLLSSNVQFSSPPTVYGPDIPGSAPAGFAQDTSLEPGIRELRVTGEATIPTAFAKVFGIQTLKVRSTAIAARRDVNIMIVLDRSGSLASAGAWDDVQEAATTFLDFFDNNGDRLGLVSFGSGANVDMSLRSGFKDGSFAANQINLMSSAGGTNSALGLWLGYAELLRTNDSSAFNVILFFTDGQPTAFPASWDVRTPGEEYGGSSTNPSCSSTPMEGVIQTYTSASEMLGFNALIAGPPTVSAQPGFAADFDVVDDCEDLNTPLGENVEYLLDSSSPLPSTWTATYDSAHGCEYCAGGESYTKTFTIIPGPYGGYSPTDATMFSTGSDAYRGTRWMAAARNIADDVAAQAGRQASLNGVTIYALGLGVAGLTANEQFLLSVSNDPDSATFDATRPEGEYIFAPTVTDLQKAFDRVRGNVIRLTR